MRETCIRGFRPGPTQIGLNDHRIWLEACNFGLRKRMNCTNSVAKTMALIGCAITPRLCFRVCKNNNRFFHDAAHWIAPFLDLHLSISNGFVSSKIYDKRDDFDFDIVNFPFLDGDVPCRPSYAVYISQLIRFARVCSHVDDFNTHNKCLTA